MRYVRRCLKWLPLAFLPLLYLLRRLRSRSSEQVEQAAVGLRPVAYFMPEEVVVLAEHRQELGAREIIELIGREIGQLSEEAPGDVRAALASLRQALARLYESDDQVEEAVLTFERKERRPFSLVFVKQVDGVRDLQLIRMFDFLNRQIVAESDEQSALNLSVVSPNWLASAAQRGTGVGPGARPTQAGRLDRQWHGSAVDDPETPFGFNLLSLPNLKDAGTEEVDVAILDTAPPRQALAQAYKQWQAEHPLLRSLLTPGVLDVRYLANPDPQLWDHHYIHGHDYRMSDHGLFVAGVIHTIAPKARLRLIEVMNPYGVGSLETLARELKQLVDPNRSRPLVINCSLMLNIPLPGHPRPNLTWTMLGIDCELIKRMGWPLQWVCEALREQNALMIAAAGNDGSAGNRPPARYPAAFTSVLGVGALGLSDIPADYSNYSDAPIRAGIATFGGAATGGSATLPKEGMLGIYIGGFPGPGGTTLVNQSGWAWWAGTSFATPVISGALAALVSQPNTTTEDAIATVRGARLNQTPDGEGIFSVRQGP